VYLEGLSIFMHGAQIASEFAAVAHHTTNDKKAGDVVVAATLLVPGVY
jgi:hypothetical protein